MLFLFGVPFNSITLVMPFLIIGVGSDDVFIIIHAMRKSDKKKSLEEQIGSNSALGNTASLLVFSGSYGRSRTLDYCYLCHKHSLLCRR